MAGVINDLDRVLEFNKELLTPEEREVLALCKSKAANYAKVGKVAVGVFVWIGLHKNWFLPATRKLGLLYQGTISADPILTLDGSILQKEFVNILLKKYQNDPIAMQSMSKHFYLETILDDSTSDTPKSRWRYRNFFSDNVLHGIDSPQFKSENGTDYRISLQAKHIFKKGGSQAVPDDSIFGYVAPSAKIRDHHQNKSSW